MDAAVEAGLLAPEEARAVSVAASQVASLQDTELVALSSSRHISDAVAVLAGAVCMLLNEKPSWRQAVATMSLPDFRSRVLAADPLSVPYRNMQIIQSLVASKRLREHVSPGVHGAISVADSPAEFLLVQWVIRCCDAVQVAHDRGRALGGVGGVHSVGGGAGGSRRASGGSGGSGGGGGWTGSTDPHSNLPPAAAPPRRASAGDAPTPATGGAAAWGSRGGGDAALPPQAQQPSALPPASAAPPFTPLRISRPPGEGSAAGSRPLPPGPASGLRTPSGHEINSPSGHQPHSAGVPSAPAATTGGAALGGYGYAHSGYGQGQGQGHSGYTYGGSGTGAAAFSGDPAPPRYPSRGDVTPYTTAGPSAGPFAGEQQYSGPYTDAGAGDIAPYSDSASPDQQRRTHRLASIEPGTPLSFGGAPHSPVDDGQGQDSAQPHHAALHTAIRRPSALPQVLQQLQRAPAALRTPSLVAFVANLAVGPGVPVLKVPAGGVGLFGRSSQPRVLFVESRGGVDCLCWGKEAPLRGGSGDAGGGDFAGGGGLAATAAGAPGGVGAAPRGRSASATPGKSPSLWSRAFTPSASRRGTNVGSAAAGGDDDSAGDGAGGSGFHLTSPTATASAAPPVASSASSVPLYELVEVVAGMATRVLQSRGRRDRAHLYISLVTATRTIDLECEDAAQRDDMLDRWRQLITLLHLQGQAAGGASGR